ncbi:hypothetical protein QBC33DRAFT_555903 [Phialemonium atrogriseum]|uniref:Uncharacterized protein n=1 Tax=Phialemonium atrogriseum TaxID=1093897 RepID=A0AAJ0C849_9PEZI|nr:uncharacterized protein QBC33DRAFT_555903 [Phialemonium atrogriseum]KAK1770419.1 hypothetical protein QBC33DRAFT_555903 [Phialemonium atrogriseum]
MAAMTSFTARFPVEQGRSGYNKDGNGDDEEDSKFVNYGRSGYNKGDKGDDGEDDQADQN